MKRIIFVDDEQRILDGLKRLLRQNRAEWDMTFVASGDLALEAFAAESFDVIVTDMRMPGMDGASLLDKIQKLYPDAVRIVLSGYTDLEATMRAIPMTHQFLTKPCDADTLKETIERACNLQTFLNDDNTRRTVGTMESLPSLPRVYSALVQALENPDTPMSTVAEIVEQDMGITIKVLQTVNSAYFGLSRKVTSVREAITYLGLTLVKNLAMSIEVFRDLEQKVRIGGFSVDSQQEHALLVARIASQILPDKKDSDDAFMAALLHDVGKLILATELPERFSPILETTIADRQPMHTVEMQLSNISHQEIGAYLLGLWNLPYRIVEAVGHHHTPWDVKQREFDVLSAVYVANILAHENTHEADEELYTYCEELNLKFLKPLGVRGQIDAWQTMAKREAELSKEFV